MRLRRRGRVREEDLAPKIAEGITFGASAEEALAEHPKQNVFTGEDAERMFREEQAKVGRVPVFRAVLRDDTSSVWTDGTDRLQKNVLVTLDPESFRAIQAGHLCLRCYEPQDSAFPEMCSMCGYPMRERQIMDVSVEFKGSDHIGPGPAVTDWMDRQERKAHAKKLREGASPMKGLKHSAS